MIVRSRLAGLRRCASGAVALALCAAAGGSTLPPTFSAETTSAGPKAADAASLPLWLQYALSADLGREDPAYHLVPDGEGGYGAANPDAGLAAVLTPSEMAITVRAGSWSLALESWGSGDDQQPLTGGAPAAEANRLSVAYESLSAWYVNGPLGLQQGWTVAAAPPGAGGPLTLVLTQGGTLAAQPGGDGRGFAITDAEGAVVLRYDGLQARDAGGRELSAWLAVDGLRVRVQVDDAGAQYPIMIDPWVRSGGLTLPGSTDDDQEGWSVALSADGTTLVAGAPRKIGGAWVGTVYVYQLPDEWHGPGDEPAGPSAGLTAGSGAGEFGAAVAVSGDGGTIVVGAPGAGVAGAAYVFTANPGFWYGKPPYAARLTAGDAVSGDDFGRAVSVSYDGSVVAVGAPGDDYARGAVYTYVRPAGGWADGTQIAKLTASDGVTDHWLGWSVAVAGNGEVVVAGAPYAGDDGQAYVFEEPAVSHTETTLLYPDAATCEGCFAFGWSVATDSCANTVAVGEPGGDGAAYIFLMPPGGWPGVSSTTESDSLYLGEEPGRLGDAVAISSDGATVFVGAPEDDLDEPIGGQGAAYIWVKPASGWGADPSEPNLWKVGASDSQPGDRVGDAVALDAAGNLAAAGGPLSDARTTDGGAVFVYSPGTGWSDGTESFRLIHGADGDQFGWSAAISADGSTAVVGAPHHDAGGFERGAAFVYVRPAGTWAGAPYAARLTAADGEDEDHLGRAVAISGDGSTVIAGAPDCCWVMDPSIMIEVPQGAGYVYERPAGGWADATQTAKLTIGWSPRDPQRANLGSSAAASVDGSTVVLGDSGGFRALVYLRPSGGWGDASQTAELLPGATCRPDGSSVAADGEARWVVTGWADSNRACLYERPGSVWEDALPAATLTATDAQYRDGLGCSVGIDADGATVVVGAPGSSCNISDQGCGTAYVFARPYEGWADATQTAALRASDGEEDDWLGYAVALSADGSTVLAGAPGRGLYGGTSVAGAVYAFARPTAGWADAAETALLTAGDHGGQLGRSVAVSQYGGTIVAGAPYDDGARFLRGSADVFGTNPAAVTDLRAADEGGYVRLDWTAVTQDIEGNGITNVTYHIYRFMDDPYYPYEGSVNWVTADTWFVDPTSGIIGDVQHSYAYLVKAEYSALVSAGSNRVGSFSFELLPGDW